MLGLRVNWAALQHFDRGFKELSADGGVNDVFVLHGSVRLGVCAIPIGFLNSFVLAMQLQGRICASKHREATSSLWVHRWATCGL